MLLRLIFQTRLEDLLQQKAKSQRVDDLVRLDRVRGLLRTIFWRRRFLAERAALRQAEVNGTSSIIGLFSLLQLTTGLHTVPAIVFEGTPLTPPFGRPSLSLDTSAISISPTNAWRTPASSPPPVDLLSPRASSVGDHYDYTSSPTRNRLDASPTTGRRASMGDDFVAALGNSEWSKMMEEELANAEDEDQ